MAAVNRAAFEKLRESEAGDGGSGGVRTRQLFPIFLRKNARRPKPVNAVL
jgi:hypothetical protein